MKRSFSIFLLSFLCSSLNVLGARADVVTGTYNDISYPNTRWVVGPYNPSLEFSGITANTIRGNETTPGDGVSLWGGNY